MIDMVVYRALCPEGHEATWTDTRLDDKVASEYACNNSRCVVIRVTYLATIGRQAERQATDTAAELSFMPTRSPFANFLAHYSEALIESLGLADLGAVRPNFTARYLNPSWYGMYASYPVLSDSRSLFQANLY